MKHLVWLLVGFAILTGGCAEFALPAPFSAPLLAPLSAPLPPSLPNGVASGDVTQTSAVLWARSTVTGPLTFTYGLVGQPEGEPIVVAVTDPWLPVTATLRSLQPDTDYTFTAETSRGERATGHLRTPAPLGVYRGLRFGASGDWRGDLAPFPATSNAPARQLDFFLALGDLIYADIGSPAVPGRAAESLADFRRKYAEVLTGLWNKAKQPNESWVKRMQ